MHRFEDQVSEFITKLGEDPVLQPHQQRVVDKLVKSHHGLVAYHSPGSGKAQPLDAKFLTPEGWILNKDLRVGDEVITQDGSATEVTGIYPQGIRPCYSVEFSDGARVLADADHLWKTQTSLERKRVNRRITKKRPSKRPTLAPYRQDFGIRTTLELQATTSTPEYRYNHSIPMVRPVVFPAKNLPIAPYALGLLCGDGSFTTSTPSFTTADIELEEALFASLSETFTNFKFSMRRKEEVDVSWSFYISQSEKDGALNFDGNFSWFKSPLARCLDAYGLLYKKSWEKHIPNDYLFGSVEQRIALLQGLMDTDGGCSSNGMTTDYCTTSPFLKDAMVHLVQSLGGTVTVSEKIKKFKYKGVIKQGRLAYIVYLKLPNDIIPFRLTRKLARFRPKTKYTPVRYVKSVTYVGDMETQCISVAHDSHLYVTEHFVVTHNTLTSIESIKALGKPTHVLPPATLQENYRKELRKWDPDKTIKGLTMQSQQNAAIGGVKSSDKGSYLVLDEAQKLRDPTSKLHQQVAKSKAQKLLMTGSGVYNHPADLSSLVNLAANKDVLPTDRADFEKKFVDYDKVNPSFLQRLAGLDAGERPHLNATPELRKAYKEYVDFYESKTDNKDFPTLKEEEKIVTMTPKQTELYNTIMGKAPMWTRMKVKAGLPPNRKELAKLRAFLTGPRQASNSTGGFYPNVPAESAKAQEAFGSFQKQMAANPHHKAVVYSNYLSSGLHDYKDLLQANNIPYGEFSGEISDKDRQESVRKFNENKIKALLISSAGGEGLDLKGTRQVQLLEPHWNEEKEKQIIGRAKRFQSHSHLPENERNVLVERYMARPTGSLLDKIIGGGHARGVDEYLRDIAKDKSALNDQVVDLLRKQQNPSLMSMFKTSGLMGGAASAAGSSIGANTVDSGFSGGASGFSPANMLAVSAGEHLGENAGKSMLGEATSGVSSLLGSSAKDVAMAGVKGLGAGAATALAAKGLNSITGINPEGGEGGYLDKVTNRIGGIANSAVAGAGVGAGVGAFAGGVGAIPGAIGGALAGAAGQSASNIVDAGVEGFGAAKDAWNTRDSALKSQADANRGPLSKPQSEWKAPAPAAPSAPMVSFNSPITPPQASAMPSAGGTSSQAPMVSFNKSPSTTPGGSGLGAGASSSPIASSAPSPTPIVGGNTKVGTEHQVIDFLRNRKKARMFCP